MAKASGPTPDDIMTPAAMKPILVKSKQEPASCALALTADKQGVLLLHKKSKPRKLMGTLKAEASKIKLNVESATFRFGTVEVDPDVDPTLVTFRVNKDVPGTFGPRFRERTKQAGFPKVQFVVDEALNEEPEEETEGAAQTTEAPETPAQQDWGGLMSTLIGLIGGIKAAAGGDAGVLGTLSKLATEASNAVKAKADYVGATGLVDRLKEASSSSHASSPAPEVKAGTAAYAKSRLAWLATRKRLESDINKLASEIVATYEDEGVGQDLASAYTSWVGPVLSALDDRLADALDAAANAADAAERTKLVADAKTLIVEYTAFLNSDPRIAELDDNPFLPLAIRSTVGGTLSTLSKAIV